MDWPVTSSGWDLADAGLQPTMDVFWEKIFWLGTLSLVLLIAGLALLAAVAITRVAKRRFWCAAARHEVEVEFVERGLPGLVWPSVVQSCSHFHPSTDVGCECACLNAMCRLPVPAAPPLQESKT